MCKVIFVLPCLFYSRWFKTVYKTTQSNVILFIIKQSKTSENQKEEEEEEAKAMSRIEARKNKIGSCWWAEPNDPNHWGKKNPRDAHAHRDQGGATFFFF